MIRMSYFIRCFSWKILKNFFNFFLFDFNFFLIDSVQQVKICTHHLIVFSYHFDNVFVAMIVCTTNWISIQKEYVHRIKYGVKSPCAQPGTGIKVSPLTSHPGSFVKLYHLFSSTSVN